MLVELRSEIKGGEKNQHWLKVRAHKHLQALAKSRAPGAHALLNAELSILLTSDAAIQKINKKWRQKNKATDVLSFPQWTQAELKRMGPGVLGLGDIIISLETATRQSKAIGHSLRAELDRLLVHGILHLLGYDHEISPKEERRMQRLEKKLLTR